MDMMMTQNDLHKKHARDSIPKIFSVLASKGNKQHKEDDMEILDEEI